jgi:hypothetical protein
MTEHKKGNRKRKGREELGVVLHEYTEKLQKNIASLFEEKVSEFIDEAEIQMFRAGLSHTSNHLFYSLPFYHTSKYLFTECVCESLFPILG